MVTKYFLNRDFLQLLLLLTLCCVPSKCQLMLGSVPIDAVGNSVDDKSVITFANVTEGEKYNSTDSSYDDGGMGPVYDFARSFVNTCLPKGFPYDLVQKIIDGKLDIGSDLQGILTDYFLGYIVAVAVGILFFLIMPVVALCFCCCRCCGNCGGKRMQKSDPSASTKKLVFGLILLVLTIMTAVGMICSFVSNDRTTEALNKVGDISSEQIGDFDKFLDNTVKQMKQISSTNFAFTRSVLNRDLDSIGFLLGNSVKDELGKATEIKDALDSVDVLSATVDTTSTKLDTVVTDSNDFKAKVTTLQTELTTVKTDIDNTLTACGGSCPGAGKPNTNQLNVATDLTKLPDMSTSKSTIDTVKAKDIGGLAREEFNNIPEKVQNDSLKTVEDLKKKIDDYQKDIDPLLTTIDKFKTDTKKSLNIDSLESDIKSYSDSAAKYNKYRWYGGIGLTCIILLIVLLQIFGLGFGVLGSSSGTPPTERGCLSNCGGIMLMASVGFIFIFAPLLMLLTTLTFAVGAPLEKYVCQPLADSDLTIFTKLVDEMGLLGGSKNGSFLANTLFKDPSIDLSIAGVLKDCKADKAAYVAFKMKYYKDFNISTLTDYKSKLDIDKQLDSLDNDINLNSVTLLTTDLEKQLDDFKQAANDFTTQEAAFSGELGKSFPDLGTFRTDLDAYIAPLPAGSAKTSLQKSSDDLAAIQTGSLAAAEQAKTKLSASVADLKTTMNTIPTAVDDLKTKLTAAETYLGTTAVNNLIKMEAKKYSDRLVGVIDSYVNDTLHALDNEVGKCKPVWNMYNGLFVNGLCRYCLDSLNGFWFLLGWCIFFFTPSIIFSVKLAKYFRRMKYLDGFDSGESGKTGNLGTAYVAPQNTTGPMLGSNKVGHADKW